MALHLDKSVVRGEFDNRKKGRVTGRIWILGREEPIDLDLRGDASPGLAGTRFTFHNPHPQSGDDGPRLCTIQIGVTGDMTVCERATPPLVASDGAIAGNSGGPPIQRTSATGIRLEWFDKTHGRVVLECPEGLSAISQPVWRMSSAEVAGHGEVNREALRRFVEECGGDLDDEGNRNTSVPHDRPRDEHQWASHISYCNRIGARFDELLDKYAHRPDRDRLVWREMGVPIETELRPEPVETPEHDAKSNAAAPPPQQGDQHEAGGWHEVTDEEDDADEKPNPLTEGVEWVYDEFGHPNHPLVTLVGHVYMLVVADLAHSGIVPTNTPGCDPDARRMHDEVFDAHMKIHQVLGSMPYGHRYDDAYVIGTLKCALQRLHAALTLVEAPGTRSLLDERRLTRLRNALLNVRQETLRTMEQFRSRK